MNYKGGDNQVVLIVEGDPHVRQSLTAVLRMMCFGIEEACDLDQAVEVIAKFHGTEREPKAIVVTVNTPERHALRLVRDANCLDTLLVCWNHESGSSRHGSRLYQPVDSWLRLKELLLEFVSKDSSALADSPA